MEELSEAFEGLRSEVEGWWEDMVIGLVDWLKKVLLLKGVGRSGRCGTIRVIVG